jgi:hypothetical protein
VTRARDVADQQDNLGGAVPPFAAGKNKIINGDFSIWQRGTTFTNPGTTAYTADRWRVQQDGTGATRTVSQQTFTPGTAPVAGYESQYFVRYAVSVVGTGNTFQNFEYNQEDIRTFAGQTVTWSFWAKADTSRVVALLYRTDFGTGGSAPNQYSVGSVTLSTSWTRYSFTYAVPSVAGLTIGTSSYGSWIFRPTAATAQTIDIWGVQIEAGTAATPFQTASGTMGGDLALCQRYCVAYGKNSGDTVQANALSGMGSTTGATEYLVAYYHPVKMRAIPTLTYSGTSNHRGAAGLIANTGAALGIGTSSQIANVGFTVASGLTANQWAMARQDSSGSGAVLFEAEL